MSKTTFQKLESLARRLEQGGAYLSGYHWPETNIQDYAQRVALGADETDYPRILSILEVLAENKAIPREIPEIADMVRRNCRGKELEY